MDLIEFEVLAPLFDFTYTGLIDTDKLFVVDYGEELLKTPEDYIFFDEKIRIKNFNLNRDYPENDNDFFSPFEKRQMDSSKWAISLTENHTNHSDYSQKLNLLLLAFRICFNTDCFIKYKLCREFPENDIKLHHTFLRIPSRDRGKTSFKLDDLKKVNSCFQNLVRLFNISYRTQYAIHYLYQGHTEYYTMTALILMFTSIEGFYLPDKRARITDTLKVRIPKFLQNEEVVNEELIEDLYKLRSDIVHGKIKDALDMKVLSPKLSLVQKILYETLKKIFDNNLIEVYKSEETKEEYFNSLK